MVAAQDRQELKPCGPGIPSPHPGDFPLWANSILPTASGLGPHFRLSLVTRHVQRFPFAFPAARPYNTATDGRCILQNGEKALVDARDVPDTASLEFGGRHEMATHQATYSRKLRPVPLVVVPAKARRR
jgi:hypothetical protein